MLLRPRRYLPIIIIIFFSLFLFRDYFFKGFVPFPANLLVSYYEPWKSYPVPEYPHGPPNKAMGFDNVRIYYPLKKVAIEAAKRFTPPLWNPYNFSGNVLLGTYQSAIFHPLSWLFLIISEIDAWTVIIMLQPIFLAFAMYIFLSVLELSISARLLGSLTFAFSGFFMTWWQESYMFTYSSLFLPLALSCIECYIKSSKRHWLALLSLNLALSICSGAFQMTFYVYAFTIVWIFYRMWNHPKRWSMYLYFALTYMLSILLASIHLLPSIEAYYYSTRVSTDVKYIFDAYLLPLQQLVTLIAPDYFGNPATYNYFSGGFYHERLIWLGTVPLILILTQLIKWKTKQPHGIFFRWVFVIALSLVLSLPTTWFLLYYLKLPLLSTMTPSRMMMLVTFAGAVLSAFAIDEYWSGVSKKTLLRVTLIMIISLGAAVTVPIMLRYLNDKNTTFLISLRNLAIPTVSIVSALITLWMTEKYKRFRSYGYAALLIILLTNSFLFAKKYLYFSERRFVYPRLAVFDALKQKTSYDRFWTYDTGYVEKNFASYYGLFSPEGYDSIMIRRYAELLAFANSHGKSMEPDRANALIQSTDHINDILADVYRKRLFELMGVRYILHKLTPDKNEQTLLPDPKDLPRIWEDGTYAIHEYDATLPRVALYTHVRVKKDEKLLLSELFATQTDIRKTVFLETKPTMSISPNASGSAHIVSYTPNTVSVTTEANGDMILFFSDVYYPGWNAYVDNKPTRVFRANYAFRAVIAPKGIHQVEFRYEPISWKLGIAGSITGLILSALLIIF